MLKLSKIVIFWKAIFLVKRGLLCFRLSLNRKEKRERVRILEGARSVFLFPADWFALSRARIRLGLKKNKIKFVPKWVKIVLSQSVRFSTVVLRFTSLNTEFSGEAIQLELFELLGRQTIHVDFRGKAPKSRKTLVFLRNRRKGQKRSSFRSKSV